MTNYNPRKNIIFRHPTDHDLCLCWKCREYKKEFCFPQRSHGLIMCLECSTKHLSEDTRGIGSLTEENRRTAIYWLNHIKDNGKIVPNNVAAQFCLPDSYIKSCWGMAGVDNPTQEMIELKRQQIISKREIKKIRKWRKENDSIIADVPGI